MKHCPVCGTDHSQFSTFRHRAGAKCPKCGALERHRLDWLLFDRVLGVRDVSGFMLHMAPENCLRPKFSAIPGIHYVTGDIAGKKVGASHRVDLHRIPFPDGKFRLIYASHVLEHVKDDLVCMREIRRVLAPSVGVAVLHVPIARGKMTWRDVYAKSPEQRRKQHGQKNHLRQYGSVDYHLILAAAGLLIDRIHSSEFASPEEHDRFALTPGVSYVCKRNDSMGSSRHDSPAA